MEATRLDEVLRRARRRDPQALAALVDAFAPRVFGLLFRLTGSREVAEELLQETFLRVVRGIDKYEHAGRFEAWLFRVAANLVRDHARRTRRRGTAVPLESGLDDDPLAAAAPPEHSDPQELLVRDEASEKLAACLDKLAASDREILLLRHFSGLSFREIADMLGIPLGTALARAHRALGRLREMFGCEA